jgi:hypothetical protein
MTDREKLQIVLPSPVAEGVPSQSLEIAPKIDKKTAENKSSPDHTDGNDEKIAVPDDDDDDGISTKETKVNFGFLPIPKRCRITPTHPFKFNLTINILFGFASTFTVISTNSGAKLTSRSRIFTTINLFLYIFQTHLMWTMIKSRMCPH